MTKNTKDTKYLKNNSHNIIMKEVICSECKQPKLIRDKAKYFLCCHKKQMLNLDSQKIQNEGDSRELKNSSVESLPSNSEDTEKGAMHTPQSSGQDSREIQDLQTKAPLKASKILEVEDNTPEEAPEHEYKFQCGSCRAMFDELGEGNTCPNPNCREVLKI